MTLRNLPTAGTSDSQTSEDQARGRPITPPTTHSSNAAYSARLCHKRMGDRSPIPWRTVTINRAQLIYGRHLVAYGPSAGGKNAARRPKWRQVLLAPGRAPKARRDWESARVYSSGRSVRRFLRCAPCCRKCFDCLVDAGTCFQELLIRKIGSTRHLKCHSERLRRSDGRWRCHQVEGD